MTADNSDEKKYNLKYFNGEKPRSIQEALKMAVTQKRKFEGAVSGAIEEFNRMGVDSVRTKLDANLIRPNKVLLAELWIEEEERKREESFEFKEDIRRDQEVTIARWSLILSFVAIQISFAAMLISIFWR